MYGSAQSICRVATLWRVWFQDGSHRDTNAATELEAKRSAVRQENDKRRAGSHSRRAVSAVQFWLPELMAMYNRPISRHDEKLLKLTTATRRSA